MDGEDPRGTGSRHPRLRGAFEKSVSWLKPKKNHSERRRTEPSDQVSEGEAEESQENNAQGSSGLAGEQLAARCRVSIEVPTVSRLTGDFRLHSSQGASSTTIHRVSSSPDLRQTTCDPNSNATSREQQPQIPTRRQPSPSETIRRKSIQHQHPSPHIPRYEMDEIEKLTLQNLLRRKMAEEGASSTGIGRFLAHTLYNRDQGLGGLITSLVDRRLPYTDIAFAVFRNLGFSLTDSMVSRLNQRNIGGVRFYNRPAQPGSGSAANFGSNQRHHHAVRTVNRRGLARPVSEYHYPPAPPPPVQSSAPRFSHARPQRYGSHLAPPLTQPNTRWSHINMPSANRSSNYSPSSSFPSAEGSGLVRDPLHIRNVSPGGIDEPPLLRAPTLERINRGYYDEEVDSVRPLPPPRNPGEWFRSRYR